MKSPFAFIALTILLSTFAGAATVETHISTREAYVGVPVILQISLTNVSEYEPPTPPSIDGCDIRSAGPPSHSTRLKIINGRRHESHSLILQYLITPRREGTFTIPAMSLQVDGKMVETESQRFVATRSETGDLLFVAIEGSQDKVYVGQSIDLTLKIWIKPFREPQTGHTLSEGDMWNLLADSTSWGGFEAKMKELAQNRQRPGGREVLREDGTGLERSYYLYEVDATIYPKRAGKIDASDVQIVVNYPTEIGESRSRMGGPFDDDLFGNSPLSQLMRDDFFGSSLGRRLAITASRPVVGQASVDATDVLPVPSEGRPSDYRGAVGRYQIVTQATPTSVDAGDPITLNIGIFGSGAMDLLQAPPLAELPNLTADFKVADEPLAGFVQDDSKVFSTTIRPRQAGTTEIPAIRFSFFDPDTEAFETVTSQPIPITVHQADMLALDSIIGPTQSTTPKTSSSSQVHSPDFTNYSGADVLLSHSPPPSPLSWWWLFVIVPPVIWLVIAIANYHRNLASWLASRLPNFQSPQKQCMTDVELASSVVAVRDAVVTYLQRRLPSNLPTTSPEGNQDDRATVAIAGLRMAGLYDLAGEAESWLAIAHRSSAEYDTIADRSTTEQHAAGGLHALKSTATDLVDRLESAIVQRKLGRMRISQRRSRDKQSLGAGGMSHTTLTILALISLSAPFELTGASSAAAQTPAGSAEVTEQTPTKLVTGRLTAGDRTTLTQSQQKILLSEANAAYAHGGESVDSDSADAKEAFATAAQKYQLVVDSGISNYKLFLNLGNAYLQTGSLGRAIANYEKASRLAPRNTQVRKNLAFAAAQVVRSSKPAASDSSTSGSRSPLELSEYQSAISQWAVFIVCLAWVIFWGLLILHALNERVVVGRYASAALVFMLLAVGTAWWSQSGLGPPQSSAVIIASSVTLHAGDGEQFGVVSTIDQAEGQTVERLNARGAWTQVQTHDGQVGWLRSHDLEIIS